VLTWPLQKLWPVPAQRRLLRPRQPPGRRWAARRVGTGGAKRRGPGALPEVWSQAAGHSVIHQGWPRCWRISPAVAHRGGSRAAPGTRRARRRGRGGPTGGCPTAADSAVRALSTAAGQVLAGRACAPPRAPGARSGRGSRRVLPPWYGMRKGAGTVRLDSEPEAGQLVVGRITSLPTCEAPSWQAVVQHVS
jgi:hypothetical protein